MVIAGCSATSGVAAHSAPTRPCSADSGACGHGVARGDGTPSDGLLVEGDGLLEAGQWDRALLAFRHAARTSPRRARPAVGIARALLDRAHLYRGALVVGEHEQVATDVTAAITAILQGATRLDPSDSLAWSELGRLLVLVQDARPAHEAVEALQRAVASGDQSVLTVGALGVSLLAAAHAKEAIPPLQRAAQLAPRVAGHAFNLGHALLAERRYDEAIVAFTNAVRLEPANPRMLFDLGEALLQADPPPARQGERAAVCYEKVIQLTPRRAAAHANLAIARGTKGDLKGAVESATLATNLDPFFGFVWLNVGVAQIWASQFSAARASFRNAASLEPDNPRVAVLLGWLTEVEDRARSRTATPRSENR